MTTTLRWRIALCTATFSGALHAQQLPPSPGAVQQQQQQTLEYYQLEKKLQEGAKPEPEIVDQGQPAAPGQLDDTKVIKINRVAVSPQSEVLSLEEINAVTSRYEGQDASIKDLFELVAAINALYKEKKCLTCRAFLPPQTVEGGIVEIRLVEGKVGEVKVEGNDSTKASFITDRIGLHPGDLVTLDTLERDLIRLNQTTDLQLKAELKPGTAFGTVDPVIVVDEPRHYQATVFSDNASRDTVGEYRLGATFVNSSVFGYRDPLALSVYGSEGTLGVTGSYSAPINRYGTRLGASYSYSQIRVISGSFESLDITGYSTDAALIATHPFRATAAMRLNGFAEVHSKESVTEFAGAMFADTNVRSAAIGVDLQTFGDARGAWYTRHTATSGLDHFGGDKEFYKYNGEVVRVQPLAPTLTLLVRAALQLTPQSNLPSSEQFQIGGMSTVRGYPEGLLIGDQGYLLSAELNFPFTSSASSSLPEWLQHSRGLVFFDNGAAFSKHPVGATITSDDFLYSAGVGAQLNFSDRVSARLIVGFPLAERQGEGDGPRVHFFIQAALF